MCLHPFSSLLIADMFIRFDVIHKRDRRTDKQTDRLRDSKDRAYASHRAVKNALSCPDRLKQYVHSDLQE